VVEEVVVGGGERAMIDSATNPRRVFRQVVVSRPLYSIHRRIDTRKARSKTVCLQRILKERVLSA